VTNATTALQQIITSCYCVNLFNIISTLVSINKVSQHLARLLFGWVTESRHGKQPATYVNSAFHPSGVDKSGTCLSGWG